MAATNAPAIQDFIETGNIPTIVPVARRLRKTETATSGTEYVSVRVPRTTPYLRVGDTERAPQTEVDEPININRQDAAGKTKSERPPKSDALLGSESSGAIRAATPASSTAIRILRKYYAKPILRDLELMIPHCGTPAVIVYAERAMRNMRQLRDHNLEDPFVRLVMALHVAMATNDQVYQYSATQYEKALSILNELWPLEKISSSKVDAAILDLKRTGFNTLAFLDTPESAGDVWSDSDEAELRLHRGRFA